MPLAERNLNTIVSPANSTNKTNAGKKRKSTSDNNDGASQPPKKKQDAKDAAAKIDVSSIHLDGEENQSVPVYDTCDEIRNKINRFLRTTPNASNAGLIRLINSAAYADSKTASAVQLRTFMGAKRGPTSGAESKVFYGAYVYFEKLRTKEAKAKSKKREAMENAWGRKGMKLTDTFRGPLFVGPKDIPTEDEFGRFTMVRMR
ncbi:hypothetical protein B0A52_09272 [Exophiala mesophila]|uniref:DUF7726 domain-containing protein n=1 Tax=Exophiala mesophila TaxID=212818 RepID=A0A438MU29_EXOME|nr:hypothetical protein B0A52_09272 [Exophiala mesophila]